MSETNISCETLDTTPAVAAILVENHRQFLRFLERRVGSREVAEDLLQAAFVRGLEQARRVRETERTTAWFYRLLRNAVVDHYRRSDVEERALAGVAREVEVAESSLDAELMDVVCSCVTSLIETLKPEYAEALRAVDLSEVELAEYAARHGITRNNAAVRLHRARAALKRQLERSCGACADHGCLDCNCERACGGGH